MQDYRVDNGIEDYFGYGIGIYGQRIEDKEG